MGIGKANIASVSTTSGASVSGGTREMHMMSKSQTTTKKLADPMIEEKLAPVHPGEILKEDFMVPMGISQYLLAKSIGVDPRRINALIHGKRAITADTALRLGRYFGVEPEFWMNLVKIHSAA
ncbi:MAG: HigA family addiction module antitoxin [Syntrophobacteraceae bacterium]|nr:HigA family addiction module antitoxin [Syntrophobacteraceae bacterium]